MKDRHLIASVISSIWGAGFFTILGFVSIALSEPEPVPLNQIGYAIGNVLVFAPWVFAVALLGFLAGTLTLGRPTAWLLRRLVLDKPVAAVLSGAFLASTATCTLLVCGVTQSGALAEFGLALVGPALSGGIAGLVYRRTLKPLPPPPPAPPS